MGSHPVERSYPIQKRSVPDLESQNERKSGRRLLLLEGFKGLLGLTHWLERGLALFSGLALDIIRLSPSNAICRVAIITRWSGMDQIFFISALMNKALLGACRYFGVIQTMP